MAKGSKASYTDKQKRQAKHIEEGYEKKGVSKKQSAARAWATVNKESGGGKKSKKSSTNSKTTSNTSSSSKRSQAAKKGWATRRKNMAKQS